MCRHFICFNPHMRPLVSLLDEVTSHPLRQRAQGSRGTLVRMIPRRCYSFAARSMSEVVFYRLPAAVHQS